jgi:hypothetical protein
VYYAPAVTSDLRAFVAEEIRLHPRVAYQSLFQASEDSGRIAAGLPALTSFRHPYAGAITIIDWDHRLPSQQLVLRILGYYSDEIGSSTSPIAIATRSSTSPTSTGSRPTRRTRSSWLPTER